MNKKENLLTNLTAMQKEELLKHFNTVYECAELSETENKIIYLAWLWKNGYVRRLEDGWMEFDETEAGVPIDDYEVTFEDEYSGGTNIALFYDYYDIEKIIAILNN
jgi:hypothetical protein